jgi:hypothetical protein
MTKPFVLLLTLLISICATAQPSQADINRAVSKSVEAADMNRMPFSLTPYSHLFQIWHLTNSKYDFIVTLKNDSEITVKSKIYSDSSDNRDYVLYVNKELPKSDSNRVRKIYCNETASITRFDTRTGDPIHGIATDSCWLFRVITGKIRAYSSLSEVQNISSEYLAGFQFGNEDIKPFDPDKLESIIKDNEKAYNAFKRGDYVQAIKKYNSSAD